jgi:hypothetical protein
LEIFLMKIKDYLLLAHGPSRAKQVAVAVGSALVLGAGSASAAATLPTEMTTAFQDLGTNAASLFGLAVALFVAIRGGTALFRIANKFFGASGA